MRFCEYKFKFYINANHAIYIDGVLGENHPHTWEITLETIKIRNDFVQFDVIEKKAEAFLARFQDCDMNKAEPFDTINPTVENIAEYLKDELSRILWDNGWLLSVIEVAETPSRSYIIDVSDDAELFKEQASKDEAGRVYTSIDEAAEQRVEEILRAAEKSE